MQTHKERPLPLLEVPEIVSGLLILFVFLWEACFVPISAESSGKLDFITTGHLMICGLVAFNTLMALLHVLATLFRRMTPNRLLCSQLILGLITTASLAGGYWESIPTPPPVACIFLVFLMGLLAAVNGALCWHHWKSREIRKKQNRWSPAVLFFTSMVAFILVSALILMTPGAAHFPIKFVDAFFMCASVASITGLASVDIATTFTPLGKAVLLIDAQVGAMGVMTFSYFILMMVGKRLATRDSVAISAILDQQGISIIPSLIRAVIFVTFSLELIGAVLLYYSWQGLPNIPQDHLWLTAIFHSVSSFCNAGISLFPGNMSHPDVARNLPGQAVMMALITAGTIGFSVYLEGITRLKRRLEGLHNPPKWSTHSWLVFRVTAFVILGGTVSLFLLSLLEPSSHGSQAGFNVWEALWNTIGRSAGFNLSEINNYGPAYKSFLCLLMFIGGNPAGTGGGVFAPLFALCLLEILRILRGQQDVTLHGRRIAHSTIGRAMATVVLSIFWIIGTTMLLLLLEPTIASSDAGIFSLLFEEVSAYTTSGYSLGITQDLSSPSKILLSFNMIFGRIGMFTFMMIFIRQKPPLPFRYPETHLPLT